MWVWFLLYFLQQCAAQVIVIRTDEISYQIGKLVFLQYRFKVLFTK